MTETVESTSPLVFTASFPPEERFVATAAEIAARLAASCGCDPAAAGDIRGAVVGAFRQALAETAAGPRGVDLTLRAANGVFDADVAFGGAELCHCSRTRSA